MYSYDGFRPKRHISGNLPEIEELLIINTKTLKQGSAVIMESGAVEAADAVADKIWGYCVGFKDDDGFTYDLRTTNFDGTYTNATTGDTYVSASNNQTVKKIKALVMPAVGVICSGKLSAATGSTTGSSLIGYYIEIETSAGNAADRLDETTASTTAGNYILVKGKTSTSAIDPEDPASTTRVMVMAAETKLFQ